MLQIEPPAANKGRDVICFMRSDAELRRLAISFPLDALHPVRTANVARAETC